MTNADSCNYCHGTKIEVRGLKTKDTDFGELEFPVLKGWPNQGVGRVKSRQKLRIMYLLPHPTPFFY